ncbi:hypothetical protein N8911_01070 [bacterium]|nr:hypothetical protein [bacterium]MDC1222335.1 hypothetical protein [Salibacteraceae bacterium]
MIRLNFVLIISLAFLIISPAFSIAQSAKVEKLVKLYFKGKEDKAISKMIQLAEKEDDKEVWNSAIQMTEYRYQHAWDNMMSMLLSGSNNITLPNRDAYFVDFINVARKADRMHENEYSAMVIRQYLVDYNPDTNLVDSAKKEFDRAEENFQAQNFHSALNHYYNAKMVQPGFYKATMYLGDCYYAMEVMDSAILYFEEAAKMYPDLLEPIKYITDANTGLFEHEKARLAALRSFYVYPDVGMFIKYQDIVAELGGNFDRHWIRRGVAANSQSVSASNVQDPIWAIYESARDEMTPFCDSNDVIIRPNKVTNAKYLEVYSWEKMLLAHPDEEKFEFAYEMVKEGYLDCYVFLSQFHYDLYPQFQVFAAENQEKIKKYMEVYLTEK